MEAWKRTFSVYRSLKITANYDMVKKKETCTMQCLYLSASKKFVNCKRKRDNF